MIALGIVLLVLGAAGAIFGVVVNSDAEMRLYALLEYGNTDPGTIFIVAGALVAALGLIFLIIGLTRRPAPRGTAPSAPRPMPSAPRPAPAARGPVCPVCGEALEEGSGFCSACGAKLDSASAPRPEPVTRPEFSAPRPVTPVTRPAFSAPRPVTPVSRPAASAPRPTGASPDDDPDATVAAEPAGRPVISSFRPVTPSVPVKPEPRKPSTPRPVTPAAPPAGFYAPDDSDL